jgi:hypothetical protein
MVYGELSPFLETRKFLEAHLSDIRSVVLPGSGHFNMTAAPELFVGPVLEHFSLVDGFSASPNASEKSSSPPQGCVLEGSPVLNAE